MSQNLNSAVSVIGIDIGKNSFHVSAAGVAVSRMLCADRVPIVNMHSKMR